ncbi:MAG: MotA/TolQ/ExbB proton channel family protein [Pirellulales bacterium]
MIRSQVETNATSEVGEPPVAENPRRRKPADLGVPLGLALAVFAVVSSVAAGGGNAWAFLDYPSLLCVFGGSLAVLLIAFPLRTLLGARRVYRAALRNRAGEAAATVETLVSLAETARRDGLLALEARTAEIEDPFLVLGVQMAVDGTRPEIIEETLRAEMEAVSRRHHVGKSLFDTVGKYAPAFGMIGTLLGLVMMLGNMNDPDAIGPGMAVALLTTLYGAVLANAVCLPLADKLGFLHRQELVVMELVVKGIIGIQQGDHPRLIERRLNLYLSPAERMSGPRVRRVPDVVEA